MDGLRTAIGGVLAGVLGFALSADLALAGCTENSEAGDVSKSIRQTIRCDYRALRSGLDPSCPVAR